MQRDRRCSSFRGWRNNEVCHVNVYVNMLHVKASNETHLALFLPNCNLAGKKKHPPQSKAIKSRAMLIQSNNLLEFTHVEVSNHYLTFQN